MECIHRPINVRQSVIKTANLGIKSKPTCTDSTTTRDSVAMDTAMMKGTSSEVVSSNEVVMDDEVTVSDIKKEVTGDRHGNTTRTCTMDNTELCYTGSVTMTTAQPSANIVGHTGYLTFATLSTHQY